jgi:hypothetical protein
MQRSTRRNQDQGGIVMNRIALRISSAPLAVTATLSVLVGIGALAHVERASRDAVVVVLPRVQVVGAVPRATPTALASTRSGINPL